MIPLYCTSSNNTTSQFHQPTSSSKWGGETDYIITINIMNIANIIIIVREHPPLDLFLSSIASISRDGDHEIIINTAITIVNAIIIIISDDH